MNMSFNYADLLHIAYIHTNEHYDYIEFVGQKVEKVEAKCNRPAVVDVKFTANLRSSVVQVNFQHPTTSCNEVLRPKQIDSSFERQRARLFFIPAFDLFFIPSILLAF